MIGLSVEVVDFWLHNAPRKWETVVLGHQHDGAG